MRISDWSSDVCSSDLTQRGSQMPRRRDHARERLLAILELLRLRDEAVRLDGIADTGGGLLAPRLEGFGLGQAIEAVVDFDRIELPRIKSEPRSEESRVGKESVSTCKSRWAPCQ